MLGNFLNAFSMSAIYAQRFIWNRIVADRRSGFKFSAFSSTSFKLRPTFVLAAPSKTGWFFVVDFWGCVEASICLSSIESEYSIDHPAILLSHPQKSKIVRMTPLHQLRLNSRNFLISKIGRDQNLFSLFIFVKSLPVSAGLRRLDVLSSASELFG